MQPDRSSAPTLSADEFVDSTIGERCELIRGAVVPLSPPGPSHGLLSHQIALELGLHVRSAGRGRVCGEAAFRTAADPVHGDTVRAPDVAYLDESFEPAHVPSRYWTGGPTLAVEVMSPADSWPRILGKAADWLAAGSREVWIAAPVSRSVHVLYDDRPARVFGHASEPGHQTLTTHLLPGFELPLDALFSVLD